MRRVLASTALALVLLQVTAVAVLLPDIRLALGSSTSGGQWVLNAYLLALAALLPACVTLRGRALTLAGAVVLAGGAAVCATADSTGALVAGQVAQGAGAAALVAAAIGPEASITSAVLPGLALAFGPLVGGVFAEQNWWHVFFWAGVPLAVVAGAGALLAPRTEPTDGMSPIRLVALAAGLTAITIAEVQSEVWDWGWWALLLLGGVALLGRAVPDLRPATLAWAALAGCLAALVFLVPEYFQLARNLSGLRSATLLLTVTFPAVVVWSASILFGRRIPALIRGAAGAAFAAIGLAALATVGAHTRYALLIVALGIAGLGLGLAAGAAAGLPRPSWPGASHAAAFAGATLGLATAGAGFQFAQTDKRASGGSFEEALAAGVGWGALVLMLLLAVAALVIWLGQRRSQLAQLR
jgi:DHA2 family methylenomycin A resistance protein-like MFS transporter